MLYYEFLKLNLLYFKSYLLIILTINISQESQKQNKIKIDHIIFQNKFDEYYKEKFHKQHDWKYFFKNLSMKKILLYYI